MGSVRQMMFACGSPGSGVRPEDRFHCNFIVFCKGFFLFRYLFFNEFIGRFFMSGFKHILVTIFSVTQWENVSLRKLIGVK